MEDYVDIYLVEPNFTGVEHLGINTAFIKCFLAFARHDDVIHFWGEYSHYCNIASRLDKSLIKYHKLFIVPGMKRNFVLKGFVEFITII
jgi:hypothetical protein